MITNSYKYFQNKFDYLIFLFTFVTKLILFVLRGDEQGLEVKISRIVLQTLTFTSGTVGIAPANHGSTLLSDSRYGNYLINKTRSLIFTTTLSPLFLSSKHHIFFYINEYFVTFFLFPELISTPERTRHKKIKDL